MKNDDPTRLRHMLDASLEAVSFLGNLDAEDLTENRLVSQAVVRSLEIVGEAAAQISHSYRDTHPEVPWPKIVGMRNRLVHAYFEIDYEVVVETVKQDLPSLIETLKKLIGGTMRKNDEPIIVEQTFNTSIDAVWNAITQIDQMRQWFFENIPAFKPEVGFETQFNVQSQERNFLHMWKVTEVKPLKMISYNWKYEGYPGDSFVVFELFKQDHLIKLRLTHQVKESFPGDIPEFTRESCIEGWTFFIKNRLKEFLEKK